MIPDTWKQEYKAEVFDTWRCTFVTVKEGHEVFIHRIVNVAEGAIPPSRLQNDGIDFVLSDTFPKDSRAYYDASHVVAGLTFDECEARRVARRLLGVR